MEMFSDAWKCGLTVVRQPSQMFWKRLWRRQ